MYGARTAAAVGALAMCIGISGCAGAGTEVADAARQDSAALRLDARSGVSAAEAQGARLAELADALAGGTAADAQGDRLAAHAEAAGASSGEPSSSAAAHQGARLSAYAAALAAVG